MAAAKIRTLPYLCLLLIGIVYFATLREGHDWGGDFSLYILHAKNIAEGKPYLDTGYVYLAGRETDSPPAYPPLLPILLAPVYRLYGVNYVAFKILIQSIFLIAAGLTYALARRSGLDVLGASMAAVVFGLSGMVLQLKESIGSDGLYVVLALATLLLLDRIYSRKWDEQRPWSSAAALTLVTLLAYASRATAISLIATIAVAELLRARRVRQFGWALAACLTVGFSIYTFAILDLRGYAGQFHPDLSVYVNHALYYLHTPAALWTGVPSWGRYALGISSLLIVAWTWVKKMLRGPGILEFYTVFSVLTPIAYTSYSSWRYMLPVAPAFAIYLIRALEDLTVPKQLRAGLYAILLLAAALNVAHTERGPIDDGVAKATFQEACAFLNKDAKPESVLISWNPRVLALYTGHNCALALHSESASDDRFLAFLDSVRATHVILYQGQDFDRQWLKPFLERHPAAWSLAFSNAEFQIYRRVP